MAKKNIRAVRTMTGPKAAAKFLLEFSLEEQVAEVRSMLQAGGRVTNLAHGIAIELNIAGDDEIEAAMVQSLKINAEDLSVGYGGSVNRNSNERSEFAGKGPMFSRMQNSSTSGKKLERPKTPAEEFAEMENSSRGQAVAKRDPDEE
ncbi:MAG: hypothetical protein GY822_18610 [Deltaproteobacteria bacterium]|nr:hypothetical protein [Deltaproteobacteria bacterium]